MLFVNMVNILLKPLVVAHQGLSNKQTKTYDQYTYKTQFLSLNFDTIFGLSSADDSARMKL